jgi:hypothetical protein
MMARPSLPAGTELLISMEAGPRIGPVCSTRRAAGQPAEPDPERARRDRRNRRDDPSGRRDGAIPGWRSPSRTRAGLQRGGAAARDRAVLHHQGRRGLGARAGDGLRPDVAGRRQPAPGQPGGRRAGDIAPAAEAPADQRLPPPRASGRGQTRYPRQHARMLCAAATAWSRRKAPTMRARWRRWTGWG